MTSTPILGCGACSFGTSYFGFGQPATRSPVAKTVFKKDDGTTGTAKKINPTTRDYELDPETGLAVGVDAVEQQVYLALLTVKGSSVIADLGQSFTSLKTIPENLNISISTLVNEALSSLVSRRLISIAQIATELSLTKQLFIKIQYRDLTLGQTNTVTV